MEPNLEISKLTITGKKRVRLNSPYDTDGRCFWSDSPLQFSEEADPKNGEYIDLEANTKYNFKRWKAYRIKGKKGDEIYVAPFDK